MRWFFLTFIALLAAIGNAAIFESGSIGRMAGGVAFNLFIVSLLVIWWSAYFSSVSAKVHRLVIGHALLMLSAGIGLSIVGVNSALAGSCEGFMSSNKSHSLKNQWIAYVQAQGYCSELAIGIALLGILLALPSFRLFIGMMRRGAASGPTRL